MEGSCNLELGLRLRPHDDRDQLSSPFTMIYNGEVCVCENVSEAQAKAILLLASRGAAEGKRWQTRTSGVDVLTLTLDPPPMPPPPPPPPMSCGSATSAMSLKGCNNATSAMSLKGCNNATSAMYMKRSLQRFLEKRKLRMQRSHASPY